MPFSTEILNWYLANKRDLPWRNTRDPYKIWLSEIILQQTRVAQGLPYYLKFVHHFPSVDHLSEASEKKVLKLWQGLGYYSRARNMHATARRVQLEMNGKFPDDYNGLMQLKGIGDYTASAIASICFNRPEPVVDGNVYRVLSRYFGVHLPVNSTEGTRYFKDLARQVMDKSQPGEYNQAIMEFGAIQCVPAKPDCGQCPISSGCVALQQNVVGLLPIKKKKNPVRKRYFNYVVPIDGEHRTLLKQRTNKGIWQYLYEFPLLESTERLEQEEVGQRLPKYLKVKGAPDLRLVSEDEIVYKLSHQHLHTRFWVLNLQGRLADGITIDELESYPVPVLISDFIKTLKNSYFYPKN